MLRKHPELEINPNNPFELDCLDRERSAKNLTQLIESTTQPFVLSIEAPWGWGKTIFILMWKAYLELNHHLCLHFNAWESDFVDDPLIAFMGEMKTAIDQEMNGVEKPAEIEKHWEGVKRLGAGVLRKTLPWAVQLATQGIVTAEDFEDLKKLFLARDDSFAEERLKGYMEEKKAIADFRKHLEELAALILKQENRPSPLVFFIDELDRCRPDFAIKLLERIKHLFSVKGFVFVLSIDRDQIVESIRALYGAGMKAEGYLRRFIDYSYRLPDPTRNASRELCKFLFNRFGLQEVFENYSKNKDAYARTLIDIFSELSEAFNFSPRVQEQCFTEINLVLRTMPGVGKYTWLLVFLVAIKTHKPEIFQQLRTGEVNDEFVLKSLDNLDDDWLKRMVEASLIAGYRSSDERLKLMSALNDTIASESASYQDKENAKWMSDAIQRYIHSGSQEIIRRLISQIDIAGEFR